MASKNIKGIVIKIGGDTTELSKALKDVNSIVAKSNSELKSLNQALKLDPKNTELLSQKQEVLRNNIKATAERLNTLKEAQKQMGSYNSLTDEQKESYRALTVEISKTETALKGMNKELKSTSGINLDGIKNGLKKVGDVALDVSKKMLQVSAAVGGALAGLVTAGVKSYASLEQNLGGVETLFKDSADKVVENAKNAWQTAGVSANEYMAGVTSFSASLLQSLGGDTEKAADIADMAFRDMSDNANKFGTDMSSIQNAYQGFAKQNYTMLDNLKLGYGGTKTEMERLLADAEKFSGVKYDIKNLSDVYSAIHVIQEELGVTGTTALEAKKTISGSVNSMKAAFDNFLNGSGSPKALADAITNVLINIGTSIQQLLPGLVEGLGTLTSSLLPILTDMLWELLPSFMDAISSIIDNIFNSLNENTTDSLGNTIAMLIEELVNFITTNLPKVLEVAITIVESLAKGLIQSAPMIIKSALDLLFSLIDTILDNLDEIVDVALTLIETLAIGLIDALPKLLEKIPIIITKLVEALTKPEMLAKIIKTALVLIVELARGLIIALPELLKMPITIITSLVSSFVDAIKRTDWGKLGSDIIKGICDGFGRIGNYITRKVNDVKDAITEKFKSIFGIHSPSTLMRDTIGFNISAGIGEGIEEGIPQALQDVDVAMKKLNRGIEASVNPTINPSMTYESNYNLMAAAMKEALQDMDIVLDDDKVGKFCIKTVEEEVYS